MAIVQGRLANIATLPSTVGSILTNPAATKTFVKGIILFNSSNSAAETVKLYLVPDNAGAIGTAAATNQIMEISLAAVETLMLEFPGNGLVLEDTNDTIQAVTNTANRVTYAFTGLRDV